MQIREYESQDRNGVVRLWETVFPNSAPHNKPEKMIDQKLAVKDGLFFVGLNGDQVAATVMAGYDGHRGWLYAVAVDPELQRKGLGGEILEYAFERLKERGCDKVNLQVRADNHPVIAFYESLGFFTEDRLSMGKHLN